MTSSFRKDHYIIHKFKYGDYVDEPKLGLDDIIFDDSQDDVPKDNETQPDKGGSAMPEPPQPPWPKPNQRKNNLSYGNILIKLSTR